MNITKELIQKLRAATGIGIMDAKKALQQARGDYVQAVDFLKKQGKVVAEKKQDRLTNEGVIGVYVHTNNKIVATVAVACESDFVANTDDFKNLAHELAMQIAATDPQYISPDDVPKDKIAKEKEVYKEVLKKEGKPEKIMKKIITGKLEKFYSDVCLIKQVYIKDDKKTVEELIQEAIQKFGENIQIIEFNKMSL